MWEAIRLVHATAGLFIGVLGLIQIILGKGGSRHRTLGQLYFWCWPFLILTAGLLGNVLITLSGLFGLYMVFSGMRLAVRKRIPKKKVDKAVNALALVCSFIAIVWAVAEMILADQMAIGELTFGVIFAYLALVDRMDFFLARAIRKRSGQRKQWYFEHISRMYVSYIVAITLFIVIQKIFSYPLLNWVIPILLGAVLLFLSLSYFNRKLQEQKSSARK